MNETHPDLVYQVINASSARCTTTVPLEV